MAVDTSPRFLEIGGLLLSSTNPKHEEFLGRVLAAPRLTAGDILRVEKQQGVYIWWLAEHPHICLKVGRAVLGARQEGLRRRIGRHLSSDTANTVLARHLAGDRTSSWCRGFDLADRSARKLFLATKCVFQVLALPELSKDDLDAFEKQVEDQLIPCYVDYVRDARRQVDDNHRLPHDFGLQRHSRFRTTSVSPDE